MRRQLVWVKTPDFQGWGCSECAWRFSPLGPVVGNSIDEMKQNYERQRDQDFASHSCTDFPRPNNPKQK
jgi:hypothetical protein